MKLYLVHVGFYDVDIGIYELHSNIFVVAEDVFTAKNNIMDRPIFKNRQMHIDGIQEISSVDGYDIILSKSIDNVSNNKTFGYNDVKNLI